MQSIKWRKRSTFQEATNSQIEYVEEKLKIKFPTDYREFIKDHNGCSPIDRKVVLFQDSRESINNLLSIGDPTRPTDLLSTIDNVKDRLVDNIIPFATEFRAEYNTKEPRLAVLLVYIPILNKLLHYYWTVP
ncbi:SMI1/KNR4 family protein [Bacillus sp. HU-1818]|uniref:SMI1/KNR4 family protein n=1 Tax=Bacillus sp. HU-1818 TaxID=2704469 RepID=UPI001F5C590A|nr:SMI1/KNR4 family protein [Bacillus sp. HU-1818]